MSSLRLKDELIANANYLASWGKGILNADELANKSMQKLLASKSSNSHDFLGYLFTACPTVIQQHFSGVMLNKDEFFPCMVAGAMQIPDMLKKLGVLTGVNVGKGSFQNCHSHMFYEAGARFAKCHVVMKFGLVVNAKRIAGYALRCQENGLVPVIEPEILVDGSDDIHKFAKVREYVLPILYQALKENQVLLEGTLLALNMVTPRIGPNAPRVSLEVIVADSVLALQRTVPVAVPGVFFKHASLSEDETLILDSMNQVEGKKPWALLSSYGEKLLQNILQAWDGKEENWKKTLAVFLADLGIYNDELIANANYLGTSGKGILYADELTTTTTQKILASMSSENVGYNGCAFQELLFTAYPVPFQHFRAVTLNKDDLLHHCLAGGRPFTDILKGHDILPGVKVDQDTIQHCKKFYLAGARFAKCHAEIKFGGLGEQSQLALPIKETAYVLARHASICQKNRLVPIVDLEILIDGAHDIHKRTELIECALAMFYKALEDHHVLLEGTLLGLNIVTLGIGLNASEVIAESNVIALQRTVPVAVPAVFFKQLTAFETFVLNDMNRVKGKKPWTLSPSYGDTR